MKSRLLPVELEQRTFDLISLRLSGNHGMEYVGHGTLRWSAENCSLTAMTDGGENAIERMMQPLPCQAGKLLPIEHYLKLTGKTQNGWTVRCERLSPDNFSAVFGHANLTWNFEASDFRAGIELEREASRESLQFVSRAVTTSCYFPTWPRVTETDVKNEVFGAHRSKHDWLQYESEMGKVSVQAIDDQRSRIRVDHAAGTIPFDSMAICAALSFVSGRVVDLVATETSMTDQDSGWLRTHSQRVCSAPYMGPLSHDSRLACEYERALACLTNLFVSDRGKHIARLLQACINAADNNFTTQAMVLCSTVESLAVMLKQPKEKNEKTHARKMQLRAAKDAVGKMLAEMKLPETDVRRIEGLFPMLEATSAKSILNDFAGTGWAQITTDEVSAWSRLRNKVMHGTLALSTTTPAKVQTEIQCQQLVANLINKIILQISGYHGHFFDYSCWNIAPFSHPPE